MIFANLICLVIVASSAVADPIVTSQQWPVYWDIGTVSTRSDDSHFLFPLLDACGINFVAQGSVLTLTLGVPKADIERTIFLVNAFHARRLLIIAPPTEPMAFFFNVPTKARGI